VNGFLGGIAWALLVARLCQLYPNGNAATIVRRFFVIITVWSWPQPVILRRIEGGPLNVRVWNPRLYPGDRAHKMPIITPAYPSMCSTHNVMKSTMDVMKEELERGRLITEQIWNGEAEWSELFQRHSFFSKYIYYLQVIASCCDEAEHAKWSAAVESKLRQLVAKLELIDTLARVHPFIKGFDRTYYALTDEDQGAIVLGNPPEALQIRTATDVKDNPNTTPIYTTTYYIGLEIAKPASTGPRKLDISQPTSDFMKLARSWEYYKNDIMGIAVRHIRRFVQTWLTLVC
jgi:poly(A) polymerase